MCGGNCLLGPNPPPDYHKVPKRDMLQLRTRRFLDTHPMWVIGYSCLLDVSIQPSRSLTHALWFWEPHYYGDTHKKSQTSQEDKEDIYFGSLSPSKLYSTKPPTKRIQCLHWSGFRAISTEKTRWYINIHIKQGGGGAFATLWLVTIFNSMWCGELSLCERSIYYARLIRKG